MLSFPLTVRSRHAALQATARAVQAKAECFVNDALTRSLAPVGVAIEADLH